MKVKNHNQKSKEKEEDLNNDYYITLFWGGRMNAITRRLLLSAVGGGLLVLGILSVYNGLSTNTPLYSIPAIVFLVISGISFWQAFQ